LRLSAGGRVRMNEAKGGMSYQAAHDPRIHFGLGDAAKVDWLEVKWPRGTVDTLTGVAADRVVTVREGQGEVPSHYPALRGGAGVQSCGGPPRPPCPGVGTRGGPGDP